MTTLADGTAFLLALAADSGGRMVMQQVGESVEGRPIWLARIGSTEAPPYAATPDSALWVGTQHGLEPQGWQAAIQWCRDLVDDPDWTSYLSAHPAYVIPCANPDRFMVDQMNADGININRDHMTLATPEGYAIQQVIGNVSPQLILDMHTGGDLDMEVQSADACDTDPAIVAISAAARDHLIGHLIEEGITSQPYPTSGAEPRMLWTAAGLRHAVGILTEVRSSVGNPLVDPTLRTQVGWYIETVHELARWHAAHADSIRSAQAMSRMRATARGDRGAPFALGTTGPLIGSAPAGYALTPEQVSATADVLEAMGITVDGGHVSMSQPARNLIPYLLDSRASSAVAAARPVSPVPAGARLSGEGVVGAGGYVHVVDRIEYRMAGLSAPTGGA